MKILAYLLTPQPIKGIPYRIGQQYPFFGDIISLAGHIRKKTTITDWFDDTAVELLSDEKNLGRGICQVILGLGNSGRIVMVTDYKEAEEILTKRTSEFDRADQSISVFKWLVPSGQIALKSIKDQMWKHHRRVLGPSMTSKNLAGFLPRANRVLDNLINLWMEKIKSIERASKPGVVSSSGTRAFNVDLDMNCATVDLILEITFGDSFGCLKTVTDQVLDIAPFIPIDQDDSPVVFSTSPPDLFASFKYLIEAFPMLSAFPRITGFLQRFGSTYGLHQTRLDNFLKGKMDDGFARALARGSERKEMADNVLDLCCIKEGGPDSLSKAELRDELLQFLVAGVDTTQSALCWWIKHATRHPQVQLKLREELLKAGLGQKSYSYEDLSSVNTPYLSAVVNEALRVQSPAGGFVRQAVSDVEVMGHKLPKGTVVHFPVVLWHKYPSKLWQAHGFNNYRSEDITPTTDIEMEKTTGEWNHDFDVFRPERWIVDGTFDALAGPFKPFSAGPRGCFGKSLALMDLKVFVARLTLAFFFDKVPNSLDTDAHHEFITRKPKQTYISPKLWSSL